MKLQTEMAVVALLVGSISAQAQQATNWNNSSTSFSATNGVYDNRGNRIGHEVQSPSGVTNVYSNDGRSMGYVPVTKR